MRELQLALFSIQTLARFNECQPLCYILVQTFAI